MHEHDHQQFSLAEMNEYWFHDGHVTPINRNIAIISGVLAGAAFSLANPLLATIATTLGTIGAWEQRHIEDLNHLNRERAEHQEHPPQM